MNSYTKPGTLPPPTEATRVTEATKDLSTMELTIETYARVQNRLIRELSTAPQRTQTPTWTSLKEDAQRIQMINELHTALLRFVLRNNIEKAMKHVAVDPHTEKMFGKVNPLYQEGREIVTRRTAGVHEQSFRNTPVAYMVNPTTIRITSGPTVSSTKPRPLTVKENGDKSPTPLVIDLDRPETQKSGQENSARNQGRTSIIVGSVAPLNLSTSKFKTTQKIELLKVQKTEMKSKKVTRPRTRSCQ
jgi:hypothetical protein